MRHAIVLVAGVVGLAACRGAAPGDRGLSDRLAEAAREGAVVDLAALAPFAWTRACAFAPYTTQAAAETALRFAWPYPWGDIETLDDRAFVVLVDDAQEGGGRVVAAFDHPRDRGDLAGQEPACVERDRARFVVVRDGDLADGAPHLVLRPAP